MALRRRKARKKPLQGLLGDAPPLVVLAGLAVALLRTSGGARTAPPRGLRPAPKAPQRAAGAGLEPGRGRRAASPREIPRRGWKDILLRTRQEFAEDQVPLISAGVTFYTLLALFPGLAAFVSLYGLFADPGEAYRHLRALSFVLPPAALTFLGEQMIRLAAGSAGRQSLTFIVGLAGSIWSANGAVKALITGLNIAYEEEERRSLVRRTVISLAFTLGFLLFVFATVGLFAAQPAIAALAGPQAATLFGWISWPAILVLLVTGLALLYRFGPSRDPVQWKWISWGSAGVVLFWMVASALFSLYVGNFAHYDKTYGSLGAAIGFMMWIYLSTVLVLAGAELNSEIEHQTAVDTTVGAPRPMGLRQARMADTLGARQGR